MEYMVSKVTLTMDSDGTTNTTATVYASIVILLRGAACQVSLADIPLCSAGPCTFFSEATVLKAACRGRFHQCVTQFHRASRAPSLHGGACRARGWRLVRHSDRVPGGRLHTCIFSGDRREDRRESREKEGTKTPGYKDAGVCVTAMARCDALLGSFDPTQMKTSDAQQKRARACAGRRNGAPKTPKPCGAQDAQAMAPKTPKTSVRQFAFGSLGRLGLSWAHIERTAWSVLGKVMVANI